MKGDPERKAWQARASEAADYYQEHGGDNMTAVERAAYEKLVKEAQGAAGQHDEAR